MHIMRRILETLCVVLLCSSLLSPCDAWGQTSKGTTKSSAGREKVKPRSPKSAATQRDQQSEGVRKAKQQGPFKYTGTETKRDPFMAPARFVKALEKPKIAKPGEKIDAGLTLPKVLIQGIVWNPNKPQAIVNNRIINVGDYIEKFEIKKITQRSIILFFEGREYEMDMMTQQQFKPKPKPASRPH